MLSRVEGLRSPIHYSRALYEARFAELYPENGVFLLRHRKRAHSGFDCYRDEYDLKQQFGARYDECYQYLYITYDSNASVANFIIFVSYIRHISILLL